MSQSDLYQIYAHVCTRFDIDPKKALVMFNIAASLHNDCVKDNKESLNPYQWFERHTEMRQKLQDYHNHYKSMEEGTFKRLFYYDDTTVRYLKFMAGRFPEEFCDVMKWSLDMYHKQLATPSA